jgi:hypothetical protein
VHSKLLDDLWQSSKCWQQYPSCIGGLIDFGVVMLGMARELKAISQPAHWVLGKPMVPWYTDGSQGSSPTKPSHGLSCRKSSVETPVLYRKTKP